MQVNGVAASFLRLLLLGVFCLYGFAQNDSRVLVLKDGRSVAIRGDYEVFGNEVQFTHSNGDFMAIALSKVDLDATDRRNEVLARGEIPQENKDGESVVERKAPTGGGRFTNIGEPEPGEEAQPETIPGERIADHPIIQDVWKKLKLESDPDQIWREVNREHGETMILVFVGTCLFSVFLALLAHFYLIFRAFQEGLGWGITLLILTFCFPIPILSFVITAYFIMNYCFPYRLALILLIIFPYLMCFVGMFLFLM